MKKFLCWLRGHDWQFEYDALKRNCPRCEKYEILVENPCPRVGQPKYEWKGYAIK